MQRRSPSGLALAGGRLKAVMQLGSLRALDLTRLRVGAGSSSGAIVASLIACGWTLEEITKQMIEDTKIVGDMIGRDPFSMSWISLAWTIGRKRAVDDGKLKYAFLGRLIERHTSNRNTTFQQAKNRFGIDLIIPASCYSTEKLVVFSTKTSPNMPILTALMASTAYPGIYLPVEINGRVYYDGGLMCNYPLRYIDILYPEYSEDTVGIQYEYPHGSAWDYRSWPSAVDVGIKIASMLYYRICYLDSQLARDYKQRTLLLNIPEEDAKQLLRISAPREELVRMEQMGYDEACAWLSRRDLATTPTLESAPEHDESDETTVI